MVKNKMPKIPWKYVKYIVVIVVGLAAFYYSTYYMRGWVSTHQDMVTLPTPARHIYPGETIGAGDIYGKRFVGAVLDPVTVTEDPEVVGKVAATELFPGEQIRKDKLIDQADALKEGEVFVSVKTDKLESVLGGRLRPNMLVDVLCTEEKASPPPPPAILAEKALVMSVTGENMEEGTQQSSVRYVLLKVKKEEGYNFTKPLTSGQVYFIQVSYKTNVPIEDTQTATNETNSDRTPAINNDRTANSPRTQINTATTGVQTNTTTNSGGSPNNIRGL